ncbi:MAG: translation initiation factor IF-1 [Xanthobacteraceae bacterium]
MSHEGNRIVMDGVVTALHRNRCDVRLNNGHVVKAVLAGRLMLHKIKCLPGDAVTVQVSPYDLTKGRIIFRHK